MTRTRATHGWLAALLISCAACGCSLLPGPSPEGPTAGDRGLDNPLFFPVADREMLWNQLVDEIDDYFKIEREQRVQEVGGVLTEGRIVTAPTAGATFLEPWHRDSTPGYERWHSTLQSLRRRAEARVIPRNNGYFVEVVVYKELEDVNQPEMANIRGDERRHDGSPARNTSRDPNGPLTLGWICLGRDISLEQQILAELQARMQK